jgi:hypothetical protein
MTYATLAFGRVKFRVLTVSLDGQEQELNREQAAEYYERTVTRPQTDAYEQQLADQRAKAQEFVGAAKVRTYEQARREYEAAPRRFGMKQGTEPEPFDEVTLDGRLRKVPPGTAQEFLQQEASRRFPEPTGPPLTVSSSFSAWFQQNSKEKRTWRAELITRDARQVLDLGRNLRWQEGFVVESAMRELDRLEREGWTLVHVSEDHGLYAGADAVDEAYLTRVRYLLHRRSER